MHASIPLMFTPGCMALAFEKVGRCATRTSRRRWFGFRTRRATAVTQVLARWFPPRRGGGAAYVNSPVEIDKLDEAHRKILVALSQHDFLPR